MKRISFEEAQALTGMPWDLAEHYPVLWHDPEVGVCALHRLMYHWTVHVGLDCVGHRTRYCYATDWLAAADFDEWNGVGEPSYWHKHPDSGRYRDKVRFGDLILLIVNGQLDSFDVAEKEHAHD